MGKLNAETFRVEMAKQNVLIRGIYQDYTHWSRVSCGIIDDVKQYAAAMPRALAAMNA
jgi:histidinol-phosphate aminotransferase